jgi:hypothetical protein
VPLSIPIACLIGLFMHGEPQLTFQFVGLTVYLAILNGIVHMSDHVSELEEELDLYGWR